MKQDTRSIGRSWMGSKKGVRFSVLLFITTKEVQTVFISHVSKVMLKIFTC